MSEIIDNSSSRRNFMFGSAVAAGAVGLVSQLASAGVAACDSGDTTPTVVPRVFDIMQYGAHRSDQPWNWNMCESNSAFAGAINAAKLAGGGIVFVPRGFYLVTSSILIDASNIRLVGEGRGITVIAGVDVSGAIISFNTAVTDTQVTNCSVEDLTLYGSSVPVRAADHAIAMYHTARCTLRNIEFWSNLKTTGDSSLLYIANSWVNHFYDLHFVGNASYASLHIHRDSLEHSGLTSNALYFFGCNFASSGTPNAVVIDVGADEGTISGEVYSFHGITCQAYSGTGFWIKRGQGVDIQGFYGEGNNVDIRLGDHADASFARSVSIENWRTLSSNIGIHLDQCTHVKIGVGMARSTIRPVYVGRASGVFLFARNAKSESLVSFDPTYARARTGVMIFDGDAHAYPDWPAVPNAMGIIMKSDADDSNHFKLFINADGKVCTEKYVINSTYLQPESPPNIVVPCTLDSSGHCTCCACAGSDE